VDAAPERDISAVEDRISIWSLLLQYACTRSEDFLRDHRIVRHLHWLSRLGIVHDPKYVSEPE